MKLSRPPGAGRSDHFPPSTDERTSALLRRVLAEIPGASVRIEYLVHQLRRRSFGGLFLLLAAIGLLPAISFLAGLAMILPGLQMTLGSRAPRLPRAIGQREIPTQRVRALGARTIPYIEKLERIIRPRWLFMTLPPMPSVIGLVVLCLGLVLMLPLPFNNLPPAVALFCLSIGLMERDGVLLLIGLVVALMALTLGAWVLDIAVRGVLPMVLERL